jgi:uncharacterized phiE125 gp8 family phage protein
MIIDRTPLISDAPFALAAVAVHCRSDDPESEQELDRMAWAAASEFEAYAQIALLEQTITVTLENGPSATLFPLPIAPLIDTLSVTVTVDGVAYTSFAAIAGKRPAIRFTAGAPCGLVVIQYKAGFGATATDIPKDIENAIYDQAAAYFDMRGEADAKSNGMSPHMARIASRYRRVAL